MNGLVIRSGVTGDLEACRAIDPIAMTDRSRADYLLRGLALAQARLLVAGDAIAGFAFAGRFMGWPFLELLLVREDLRRQGLASRLMADFEMRPDAKLFTSTNVSNNPMRRLLDRRGWVHAGTIEHLDPGDPEMFFARLRP